jgi:hypothetical protein
MVLKERGYDGVDWINLIHSNVQWQVFVNAIMNNGFMKGFSMEVVNSNEDVTWE